MKNIFCRATAPMEAPPSPLSSRAQPRDLQFRGPLLEMFFDRSVAQWRDLLFSFLILPTLAEQPSPGCAACPRRRHFESPDGRRAIATEPPPAWWLTYLRSWEP